MTKVVGIWIVLLGFAIPGFGLAAGLNSCDTNQDGSTNAADVQLIVNQALGVSQYANDLNGDGAVNVVDIELVVKAALGLGCGTGTSAASPTLTAVTPQLANSGSSLSVSITGSGTNFVQGLTVVSFGVGVTAASPVVSSPTALTVQVTIPAGAPPGLLTVTVTTGAETATLPNGFSIAGPTISLTTPANLSFVNTPSITVSGTVGDPAANVKVNGVAAPNVGGAFTTAIPLSEGNNTITAVATGAGGATATTSVQVTLDTTPPHLAILSPPAGVDTAAATINVTGTVNDIVVGTVNDQQAQVIVNGIAAQVSNRSFMASNVPLAIGANTIQVIARATVSETPQRLPSRSSEPPPRRFAPSRVTRRRLPSRLLPVRPLSWKYATQPVIWPRIRRSSSR